MLVGRRAGTASRAAGARRRGRSGGLRRRRPGRPRSVAPASADRRQRRPGARRREDALRAARRRRRRAGCAGSRAGRRGRRAPARARRRRARRAAARRPGCCRSGPAPSSWCRNHSRSCAKESGSAAGRRRAAPAARPAGAARAAARGEVAEGGGVEDGADRQLARRARRGSGRPGGWPAASGRRGAKKSSSSPTRVEAEHLGERARTAGLSSRRARARRGPRRPGRSGAGSAVRSSLPFGVSGSASSTTNAAGTMYSGSRAARRGAQARRRPAPRAPARHEVGDQPRSPAVSSRTTTAACATAGCAGERGLDLAELDAEAADLDLVVGAAEELEVAVRAPARPGRRCGTAARRARRERIGDEALRGQARAVQVAARQARARRRTARRARPTGTGCTPGVEHVRRAVGDARADHAAGRRRHVRARSSGAVGDVHGGLGDAVHVDQPRRVVAVPLVPARAARAAPAPRRRRSRRAAPERARAAAPPPRPPASAGGTPTGSG